MNKTPSILVDTGFEVDQNGALEEIVIPKVVNTCNAPRKVTFEGQTITWIPSTVAALQEFEAPNITAITNEPCNGYTALNTVKMIGLKSITHSTNNYGVFNGCTSLTSVIMPELESLSESTSNLGNGTFCNCAGLVSITFPKLKSLQSGSGRYGGNVGGTFCNCTALSSVSFPELTNITQISGGQGGPFFGCTSLATVSMPKLATITCEGQGASGIFYGCTALLSINFPELTTIDNNASTGAGVFKNSGLQTVVLPKLSTCNSANNNGGAFYGCTNLTSVQLGSEGYPVTTLGSRTFNNCTQSGLTITIYTTGGASLAGEPWGATNADTDIVYEVA